MEIIPALYILKGKIVALYKGSLEQKEIYGKSPLNFAKEFVKEGARKLYVVDLDKSEFGTDENVNIINEIRKKISVPIIYAGGVRSIEAIEECFGSGMDQVVLGVSAEEVYKQSIKKYGPDKIIVGIKAKGDEVITDLKTDFPLRVIDFAEKLPGMGVTQVLYKDVWKESTKIGPNYDEPDRILRMVSSLEVYYSGGIGKEKHLKTLKDIGVKGAVIGKALYEKDMNLFGIYDSFL
ncbi:1-(5-phosphoribosyl)-5-((5-phosphoribosylamino)methylideneamino)imidazole-4-carboxamide isomerase [bacterium]|nr:1-(5-phosphoribosyl)-5-((5-phosphoribosylamino)methylideneamino)imidazole-4-carboxamide isomerase [bacterium]